LEEAPDGLNPTVWRGLRIAIVVSNVFQGHVCWQDLQLRAAIASGIAVCCNW
jgi:hypothetical protein